MSNTYQITNIIPTYSEDSLVHLSFDIDVTDDEDRVVKLNWDFGLSQPVEGADLTSEQLLDICDQQCQTRGIYLHMDTRLLVAATPIYAGPTAPPPMTDLEKRTLWMSQIDNTIAAIYNQFTRFQMEYEAREKAAQSYKDGGYVGEPSVWVKRFADNTGITFKQCTDLVLSQANKLRKAILDLGQLRMDKYKVLNASTLEDAQVEFNIVINGANVIARSL